MLKKILLFLLILTNINFIYSICYYDFKSTENFEIQSLYTSSNYKNYDSEYSHIPTKTSQGYKIGLDENTKYKIFYFYKNNQRILPFKSERFCKGDTFTDDINLPTFKGYETRDLQNSKCEVKATLQNNKIILNSNLKYLSHSSGIQLYLPDSLKKYYHMNTKLIIKVNNEVVSDTTFLMSEYDKTKEFGIEDKYLTKQNNKIEVITDTTIEPKCDDVKAFENSFTFTIKKPKFENFETTLSDEIIPKNYINDNEKLNNKIGISEGDNLYFNGEKISSFPMSETVK